MTGAGRCLVVPKEIVASVERDGGTPMEIFHDPVVRGVFLGILRNDYYAIDSYRPVGGRPVDADITALWGRSDPRVDAERIARWGRLTRGMFRDHIFDGGHFYLVQQAKPVVGLIRRQMLVRALRPDLGDQLAASLGGTCGRT